MLFRSEAKIVEKSGAWYAYNGEKLGQGKENVKALLSQTDKLREELEAKVRTHFEINRSKKNEKEKEAK